MKVLNIEQEKYMHDLINDFKTGVYEQAILHGNDVETAEKIAAQAVLDRLEPSEAGWAVAQTEAFEPIMLYNYEFKLTNIHVDQAFGTGTVIEAVLGSTTEDVAGQKFTEEALREFAEQINEGGVGGFIDEHRTFRVEGDRLTANAVTDWVRARVEDGMLKITTKLKQGYEWIASQFNSVSLEAVIPRQNTLIQGNKKLFLGGGFLKGFVFTNNPKNPLHRIVDSFSE